nr:MAG TPA: hypothetical protein [Caudoviricetes sp.]
MYPISINYQVRRYSTSDFKFGRKTSYLLSIKENNFCKLLVNIKNL